MVKCGLESRSCGKSRAPSTGWFMGLDRVRERTSTARPRCARPASLACDSRRLHQFSVLVQLFGVRRFAQIHNVFTKNRCRVSQRVPHHAGRNLCIRKHGSGVAMPEQIGDDLIFCPCRLHRSSKRVLRIFAERHAHADSNSCSLPRAPHCCFAPPAASL